MRVLLRLLLAGVVTAVIAAGLGFVYLKSSLPQVAGRIAVPGLEQPVSIVRDGFGIPRISAASEHDAYFALGWVHAQDRLWQMELQRRAGAGRLAEVMGPAALGTDKFMRTLGLYRLTEASLLHLGPEVTAAVEAYVAGVNAWIARHDGALPPEFLLLGFRPEPWRPADTLVWGRLMGLQLAGNWREELLRARLVQRLPPERIQDLWAPSPPGAPTTVVVEDGAAAAMLAAIPELAQPHLASNVWALAGSRTESGKPLLANDPHLGFNAPILWYLVSITAPGFEVHGGTVPGVPFHLMGHNGTIAWGVTTTHSDLMDLFVEKPGPTPDTYLTPDGPAPFLMREEVIRVKGQEPVSLNVRATRHGPVISDVLGKAGQGQILALSSATLTAEDTSPRAVFLMNRAKTWPQFVEALRHFDAPQQNFAYADIHGTIGFYTPGLVPIRRKGDGLLPRPGWTGEWDWVGWVPFAELPHVADPPEGRIVNANNQVVPESYPYLIAAHWPEPYRAARIIEVLDSRARHGLEDMGPLQMDLLSPVALRFKPLIASLELQGEAARGAQRLIADWDGTVRRDRPEPLIFEAWMIRFQQALIEDDLGDLAESFTLARPLFLEQALTRRQSWCDDSRTPAPESCTDIAARAFAAAVAELVEEHGEDIAAWRWGERHYALFDHALFKEVPLLDRLARLTIPSDGGDFTVNRGTFNGAAPNVFTHSHGAGLRAVYDLSDLTNSRFMIATGQSGNLLSGHYDDLLEAWRDGAYVRIMPSTDDTALTLEPPP